MGLLAWLRGVFGREAPLPLPPSVARDDRPIEPGLSLDDARRRFRSAVTRWKEGRLSTPDVHAEMELLHRSIFHRCLTLRELTTREAYDFFNLAAEIASATSFEPKTRWIGDVALRLEAEGLGNVYSHPAWRRLVAGRGPIESFVMIKCGDCGTEFPRAGTSGFLMMDFLWCSGCGNLLSATICSEQTEHRVAPYKLRTVAEQQAEAIRLGVPHRVCRCGGTIHDVCKCPGCGSGLLWDDRVPLSPYLYFESHRCEDLESQPTSNGQ